MRRFRLPSLATITTAAVLLSAASLAGVAAARAARERGGHRVSVGRLERADQPAGQPAAGADDARRRRSTLLTGASGSSYVGLIPAIGSLCIPAINLEDGPAGRRRRHERT